MSRFTPLARCAAVVAMAWSTVAAAYPEVEPGVSFDAVLALAAEGQRSRFRYGDSPQQFVELSVPGDATSPSPVVVFLHGGCWLNQFDIGHSRALATALNQAGYAVWNIEYRRLGDEGGGWPGSLQDVLAALGLLVEQQRQDLDLNRVALAGHSAGGHLALLAAARAPAGLAPRGVFGLAPITDLARYAEGEGSCNRAAARRIAGLPAAELAAANPVMHPAPTGTVLLYGTQDRIAPFEVPYLEPEALVALPAGHFDWIHPGTPAFARFLEELGEVLK